MKIKNKNNSNYKLKSYSHRIISFINVTKEIDIELQNIIRDRDGFSFEVSSKDYKKIKTKDLSEYQIKVVKNGGLKEFFGHALYRIGLILGLIVCLISMFFLKNRILQIHVYGLSNINKTDVVEELQSYGLKKLSLMNFNKKEIEGRLANKFNFSIVSIITKGNSLIISVKESLPSIEDSYVPITADYNMVIDSIKVYSGTMNVKAGEIVYKGDVLVYPYIIRGENKVYITPCAEITADIFLNETFVFKTEETKQKRTGKKKLIDISLSLGKYKIFSKNNSITFESYEKSEKGSLIGKYLLPISINKTYAYELREDIVYRDFDKEKNKIVENMKNNIYSKVKSDWSINEENVIITPVSNGNIINVYLSCKINLVYRDYI